MIRNTLLILALGLTLVACNAVEGAGQDISGGARAVKNTF